MNIQINQHTLLQAAISSRAATVGICGLGYVGLPLAVRAVEVGYDVVGFEVDQQRVDALAEGRSYVEDIGDDRLRGALDTGRYLPSTDPSALADFDIAVISVLPATCS